MRLASAAIGDGRRRSPVDPRRPPRRPLAPPRVPPRAPPRRSARIDRLREPRLPRLGGGDRRIVALTVGVGADRPIARPRSPIGRRPVDVRRAAEMDWPITGYRAGRGGRGRNPERFRTPAGTDGTRGGGRDGRRRRPATTSERRPPPSPRSPPATGSPTTPSSTSTSTRSGRPSGGPTTRPPGTSIGRSNTPRRSGLPSTRREPGSPIAGRPVGHVDLGVRLREQVPEAVAFGPVDDVRAFPRRRPRGPSPAPRSRRRCRCVRPSPGAGRRGRRTPPRGTAGRTVGGVIAHRFREVVGEVVCPALVETFAGRGERLRGVPGVGAVGECPPAATPSWKSSCPL